MEAVNLCVRRFLGRSLVMSEIESGLHKVLEEHQHESGLHIIGGRNKLVARLAEFFDHLAHGEQQGEQETAHTAN
jgi:hypothetical protein